MLKSVYSRNKALAGFGAFDLDDIYLKLLKYKQNLKSIEPAKPIPQATGTVVPAQSANQLQAMDHGTTPEVASTPKYFVVVLALEKCLTTSIPRNCMI